MRMRGSLFLNYLINILEIYNPEIETHVINNKGKQKETNRNESIMNKALQ